VKDASDADIKLTVTSPDVLMAQVATGGLDLAVVPRLDIPDGFDQILFHEEMNSLYCGRLHPLFKGRPSRAGVEASAFVVRPYANNRELHFFARARVRAHAANMEAQAAFILSGEFVGYLPEHYADHWVRRGRMRTLMSPETRIVRPFVVVTKSDTASSPLQRLFIRGLVAEGVHAQEKRLTAAARAVLDAAPGRRARGRVKSKKSI
jgi:DNA-binding transcriptional LysR family regulator